jgi:hypothetical protein
LTVTGNLSVSGNASTTGSGTLKSAIINSDTGAISFGDENLSTTGTLGVTGLATFGNSTTTLATITTLWPTNVYGFTLQGAITGNSQSITGLSQLTVTGTTATSTFSTGGLTVGTSQFVVQQTSGNVGIGTTTPTVPLQVTTSSANATTTVEFGKVNQTRGTCLKMYNSVGTLTYCKIDGATFACSATSCE